VNRKAPAPIPEPIAQLQRQFDQFRSTQPRRTKLPESLWQAAVELARKHGVYPVAHPLRLGYTRLKELATQIMVAAPGKFTFIERRQLSRIRDEQKLTPSQFFVCVW
jgi:hypothetical protein